ncbi:MAG: DUF4407 domain-containing protein [Lewinella sp.]|nr:DUF4407 domain-containing protein [Lewinella sp.]
MTASSADPRPNRSLAKHLPRLALILLAAIALSVPLLLVLYSGEINGLLDDRQMARLAAMEEPIHEQIRQKEEKIEQFQENTEAKLQIREKDYQDYRCECDGTCGTGRTGRGSECARKEARYLQSDREYQEAKAQNDAQVVQLQAEIEALAAEVEQVQAAGRESSSNHNLAARLSALMELPVGPRVLIPLLLFIAGSGLSFARRPRRS